MNELEVFSNNEFGEVRTVVIDGEPLFCLIDICKALELSNSRNVADRLDEDERRKLDLPRQGATWFVTESGLYAVVLRSDKPNAKNFRKWITSEVLPSIRKTGTYSVEQSTPNVPMTYRDAVAQLLESLDREEELKAQLDTSKDWYSIKRVAALNGVSWKRFDWRKLKATGITMGYEVKKIFDANYGEVNTYHKSVWEKAYPQYELQKNQESDTTLLFFEKVLDLYLETLYNVSRNKEVIPIAPKSRADYFKERRKKTKNFSVEIEKEKFEKLEEKLSQKGLTKTKWFNEKVDEEIGN